MVVVGEPRFLV